MAAQASHDQKTGIPASQALVISDLVEIAPAAIVSRVLARTDGGSVTLFALAAGEGISEHTTPFDALVQVIDGELELVIGGEKIQARAGELVLMPADVPHALAAPGDAKMLLTMLKTISGQGKKE
jgi:quercetin dioxygenase-like cupin family protein